MASYHTFGGGKKKSNFYIEGRGGVEIEKTPYWGCGKRLLSAICRMGYDSDRFI